MKPENPKLDARFTTRPATLEDTGQVHELFTEYWKTLTGVTKFTLEEFQQIFSAPGFEIGESTLLVLSPAGEGLQLMVRVPQEVKAWARPWSHGWLALAAA